MGFNLIKNNIILFLLLFICASTYSQEVRNQEWDNISIYEYGILLTSCECNFKNLFNNWNRSINNYQETELLSYKYLTTLKDSIDIKYYEDLLNGLSSLGRTLSVSTFQKMNADSIIYSRDIVFEFNPLSEMSDSIKGNPDSMASYYSEIENIIKNQKSYFKKEVQMNDKVFVIYLKNKWGMHKHYVICSNKNNKIIFDTLFFDIYLMHIEN